MAKPVASFVLILISVFLGACPEESGTSTSETSRQLELRAMEIVEQLVDHDFAAIRADFDETMLASLSEEGLRQAVTDVEAEWGELISSEGDPQVVPRGELTVINVPVRFEKRSGQVRVTFRQDGKIAGFFILQPGVP